MISSAMIMNEDIQQLAMLAVEKAKKSGSLDDISKAAEISKSFSETLKVHTDSENSKMQMRYEGVKSLAVLLVPIASLITVLLTVYMQYSQLSETHKQN